MNPTNELFHQYHIDAVYCKNYKIYAPSTRRFEQNIFNLNKEACAKAENVTTDQITEKIYQDDKGNFTCFFYFADAMKDHKLKHAPVGLYESVVPF